MIFDQLTNAALYTALGPGIARGLAFLASTDLQALSPGKHELDGKRLFVLVSDYTTKPEADGRWEAHRDYLDLQYMVSGIERMGIAPTTHLRETDYQADRDIVWLEGAGDFVTFVAGQFMILWPGDAHMPGIAVNHPVKGRKVVVKIGRHL
jgi:YhcH/YjgK/YiaL family protein